MDLHGRVALVTGSRRIGGHVAASLASAGADVGIVYRRSSSAAAGTADAIRAHGRRALVLQADLADAGACRHVVDETAATLGGLDVLVALASLYERRALDDISLEDWEAQMQVELRSAFVCARHAVPHMRQAGGGRIILVTDWLARSGRPRYQGYLTYYVAKAGLQALAESLALELAPDRILVNALAPGPIEPPPDLTPQEVAQAAAATPLGRWGGAGEVVTAVRFLIDSDFVTGETIRVDGGRHLR
jgi:NAD(P)-dependent dehydrogenase (short-subunit alcohol dehydrogenase family)